jgi:hypothetical protein
MKRDTTEYNSQKHLYIQEILVQEPLGIEALLES